MLERSEHEIRMTKRSRKIQEFYRIARKYHILNKYIMIISLNIGVLLDSMITKIYIKMLCIKNEKYCKICKKLFKVENQP